jgi:hypothetical protein
MEPSEIVKYRHDLEVVRNTAEQVIRDFSLMGLEVRFSGNPDSAYSELFEQVAPSLKQLYDRNSSAFMALLYRIDVDERKVDLLRDKYKGAQFFNELAALVLEREFIKVMYRKLYRHLNG